MTPDEARTLLAFHAGTHLEVTDPRWTGGFLGMLRPYGGLREESFHEVIACIVVLADELSADRLDRSIISALWGICHLARAWGVEEGGMLRSNALIKSEDVERLAEWIGCISYATFCLLDGSGLEVALEPYRQIGKRS
jgi:hypothetical protein